MLYITLAVSLFINIICFILIHVMSASYDRAEKSHAKLLKVFRILSNRECGISEQ